MVTITEASRQHEGIIQRLVQLYTHDFSEFWAGTTRGDLLPDGTFEPYPLDEYWDMPGSRWAFLVWNDGILAGFALVSNKAHSGEIFDYNMAEFFILRKHRGAGIGRQAAELIFSRLPGRWKVAIARKNVKAGQFWRKTVDNTERVKNFTETDLNNEHWNGAVLRFEWV